jgi:hypothetical protein
MIATSSNANKSKTFWETLPFVLPCKFCRASLSQYYEILPIPTKQEDYSEWLYKIHNLVNQKLRDQGQNLPPDPSFEAVKQRYKEILSQGCSKTEFPGWNFLFSIADCHPGSTPSTPMPDVPVPAPKSLSEKNKYNLLTPKERKEQLNKFWKNLPDVLPFEEWKLSWIKYSGTLNKAIQTRRSAMCWLYRIKRGMEKDLQKISKTNFYGLCKHIAIHRSGCSKSKRARTCRKMVGGKRTRKTRRNKQR